LAAGALAVLVALGVVALLADPIAPYGVSKADWAVLTNPPSGDHWLGTDLLGRDVLTRIIFGSRITLLIAFASVALGNGVGFIWGVITGYVSGNFDIISQRFLDVFLAIPTIILALLMLVAFGAGLTTVVVAIAVSFVPGSARIIRSAALSVREMPYVEAARTVGASPLRIMAYHVAPQCIAPFLINASFSLGVAIFAEAALSFLGLGVPPPAPTWGNMLGGITASLFKPPWWLVVFPGVAITITVLAFNLLGDGLRDYLDPRLRGRLG
jgi:ABC-type dipeptide/oligopeptide/nickel transport system permease subunit